MKLFSKIATAFVGIAMAVGVGVVATSQHNVKEARADSASFTLSSASDITVDGVTASFAKSSGSNAPAWYDAGLRLYASNTITISSSNTITGVSFNWEKQGSKAFNTVTADVGTYTHPAAAGVGTWSGSATNIVFTLGSTGQLQLNTFTVTYSGGDTPVLTGISLDVSGAQTEYVEGNAVSFDNITVTGSYESSDPKDITSQATIVADIDTVSLETTQITYTASYGGFDDSDVVSVTVSPKPAADEYELFSGDIEEGDYLVVYDSAAMNTTVTSNRLQFTEVTITDNKIETNDEEIVWHIAADDSYWTLYNESVGKYAGSTGSKNQATLISSLTDNARWTVTGDATYDFENLARSTGTDPNNKWLRKNTTYGFACYTNSTGGALSLYKKSGEPTPTTTYEVVDEVENGTLNKSSVKEGATLQTTITPSEGYDLPESVTVTMGGDDVEFTYLDGVVTVENVTGDIVISGECSKLHGYWPEDPFTVAEAIAEIDAKTTASGAYVSGIISQIDSYNSTYKSIQYWISDDGTTTTQLECYSGKGLNGADFAAKEDIEVGATVVVTGLLKKYNSTYEFDYNNYQYSYVPPVHEDPTLTLSSYHTHLVNGGDSYVITASYESFSATPTLSVDGDPSYVGVTISDNTITLSPTAAGTETLTIRATYNSEIDTKDFKLVVTTNAGTAASPFTVEEAKAVIDVMENISGNVVGVVSQVDSYSSDYHSITYWLSDDGTTTSQQLEVYSGKGYNGANFNEVGDMVTGTKVVVNGTLKIYNTTYEFDKNNKVVGFPNVDAFAQELLTRTDEVCVGYKEGDNNHDAIAAIWETLSGASYYGKLTSTEKAFIISVEGKEDGSTVEQAMARYDFLTARYELDNFISRSLSSVLVKTQPISNSQVNTNVAMIAVIVVAVTSLSAIGVLLVVKKRKYHI